jgi:uncharacterized protein (DUF1330 family)
VRYYAIAELDIEDPSWVRDYVANVTPMVERHGGRYLARLTRRGLGWTDRARGSDIHLR